MSLAQPRKRLLLAGLALALVGGAVVAWKLRRDVRQAFEAPTRRVQPLAFAPLPAPAVKVRRWGGAEVTGVALGLEGLVLAGGFGVADARGELGEGLPTLQASVLALWRDRPVVALAAGGLFLRRDRAWEEFRTGWGTLHVRDLAESPGGELLIGAQEGLFRAAWGAAALERLDGAPVRSLALAPGGVVWAGGEQGLRRVDAGSAKGVAAPDPWVDAVAVLGRDLLVLTPQGLARGPFDGPLAPVAGAEAANSFAVLGDEVYTAGQGRLLRFGAGGRPAEELPGSPVRRVFARAGILFADTDAGLLRRSAGGWSPARPRPASLPPGPSAVNALAWRDGRVIVGLFNGGLVVGSLDGASRSAAEGPDLGWAPVRGSEAWGVNAILIAGGAVHVASLRGVARLEGGALSALEPKDAGAAFSLAASREGLVHGYGQGVLLPGPRLLSAFHGLPGNQALALAEGPEGSNLLFVGTPTGLGAIAGGRVAWRTEPGDGRLPHPWVTALAVRGDDLYVGTYGGGVARRAGRQAGWREPGAFAAFPETAGVKVNPGCLVEAGGRLYLGTDGRGLWRLSADGSRFVPLRLPLPSQHVTAIQAGPEGLYVGTPEGLARLPLSLPEEPS
ncbi:MAG: hypothetical protein U0P81_08030 [Holophagaceae bacterium]